MNLVQKLGERIRFIRKEQGLSQEVLAERAGLHTNYLGAVERGEKNVTVESLEKISHGLGVTLDELFRYIDPMDYKDDIANIVELLSTRTDADRKMALTLLLSVFNWEENKYQP